MLSTITHWTGQAHQGELLNPNVNRAKAMKHYLTEEVSYPIHPPSELGVHYVFRKKKSGKSYKTTLLSS